MGFLLDFWHSLTQPQATVIAAIVPTLATALGLLISRFWANHREKKLDNKLDTVERTLDNKLDTVATTAIRTDNALIALEEAREILSKEDDPSTQLRSSWSEIKSALEKIAASETDGRRSAKYLRIDRRSFGDLIEALYIDKKIDQQLYADSKSALQIANSHKRRVPGASAIEEMTRIANKVSNRVQK